MFNLCLCILQCVSSMVLQASARRHRGPGVISAEKQRIYRVYAYAFASASVMYCVHVRHNHRSPRTKMTAGSGEQLLCHQLQLLLVIACNCCCRCCMLDPTGARQTAILISARLLDPTGAPVHTACNEKAFLIFQCKREGKKSCLRL